MTKAPSNGVEVERDGVKLGWNVLAIMASIGLGLYVTSIVSPLKHNQTILQADLIKIRKEVEQHNTHIFDDHVKYGIAIKEQQKDVENLEEDVAELKSDIKSLKGNHHHEN